MQALASRRSLRAPAPTSSRVQNRQGFVNLRVQQQRQQASHIVRVMEIEGEAMWEKEVLKVSRAETFSVSHA